MNEPVLNEKLLRMRQDFDRAFALPVAAGSPDTEDFLALRAAGGGFVLRAREINGLAAERPITPMPGAPAAFLGLAGLRSGLVPVWDLAALLGCHGPRTENRWLVLGPGDAPWALAFEGFEGYHRLPRQDLRPAGGKDPAAYASGTCLLNGSARPVLDLSSLLAAVKKISQSIQSKRGSS